MPSAIQVSFSSTHSQILMDHVFLVEVVVCWMAWQFYVCLAIQILNPGSFMVLVLHRVAERRRKKNGNKKSRHTLANKNQGRFSHVIDVMVSVPLPARPPSVKFWMRIKSCVPSDALNSHAPHVRKVANPCVFSMICDSGCSKSRLAKAAGAEVAVEQRN